MESGLKEFCERWRKEGPSILRKRLESVLDKKFQLSGGGQVFMVEVKKGEAKLHAGPVPGCHAEIGMPVEGWIKVLKGDYNIQGVIMAERCNYFKHQRQLITQLSLIIQTVFLKKGIV